MKILLEIPENEVSFVMKLLQKLNVKSTKVISDEKAELMNDIRESVKELNLIKQGKLEGIPVKELLDEL